MWKFTLNSDTKCTNMVQDWESLFCFMKDHVPGPFVVRNETVQGQALICETDLFDQGKVDSCALRWATVSLELDLTSFCRPTSIQESKTQPAASTWCHSAKHAGNSSLCHQFFEASYVPRTLKARGSSRHAHICSSLGSPSVKPLLCLPLFLPLLVEDWPFDCSPFVPTLSFALAFGRGVLLVALAFILCDFFPWLVLFPFGLSLDLACSFGHVSLSNQLPLVTGRFLDIKLSTSSSEDGPPCLGKSCTTLGDRTCFKKPLLLPSPLLFWNLIHSATHRESCRPPPLSTHLDGFIFDMSLTTLPFLYFACSSAFFSPLVRLPPSHPLRSSRVCPSTRAKLTAPAIRTDNQGNQGKSSVEILDLCTVSQAKLCHERFMIHLCLQLFDLVNFYGCQEANVTSCALLCSILVVPRSFQAVLVLRKEKPCGMKTTELLQGTSLETLECRSLTDCARDCRICSNGEKQKGTMSSELALTTARDTVTGNQSGSGSG